MLESPQFSQDKLSLFGLFADEASVGVESHFVIQDGAQVPILAHCLYSYATDESRCRDRGRLEEVRLTIIESSANFVMNLDSNIL